MPGAMPTGYNANAMNRQTVQQLNVPGQLSMAANPANDAYKYASSFISPSSLHMPSSVPAPDPFYNPQPQQQQNPEVAAMIAALKGGQ